ncbi:MAG: DUF2721 domain-containing protein [Bacteroidales bacterium]|nr:DUF2721 domain-containing protein [Bacteroidales bacterium]
MKLSLTTPAVLFSAISLLLLAYTNRFLTIAQLVRNLHAKYKENRTAILFGQIKNLRLRISLIRYMQILGIISLLLCVFCMFLLYIDLSLIAEVIFGVALLLLICSLGLSVWEIQISARALNLHLSDIED